MAEIESKEGAEAHLPRAVILLPVEGEGDGGLFADLELGCGTEEGVGRAEEGREGACEVVVQQAVGRKHPFGRAGSHEGARAVGIEVEALSGLIAHHGRNAHRAVGVAAPTLVLPVEPEGEVEVPREGADVVEREVLHEACSRGGVFAEGGTHSEPHPDIEPRVEGRAAPPGRGPEGGGERPHRGRGCQAVGGFGSRIGLCPHRDETCGEEEEKKANLFHRGKNTFFEGQRQMFCAFLPEVRKIQEVCPVLCCYSMPRRGRFEQGQPSGIAFALHVGLRHEAEGGAVDAVAQSAGGFRAVVEDVTQMGIAAGTTHLGALHTVAAVVVFGQEVGVDGFGEGRPAAARLKLVGGEEERLAGGDVYIDALAKLCGIFVGVGALRGGLLGDGILEVGKTGFEVGIGGSLEGFRGRSSVGGFGKLEEGAGDVAIAGGVLVEIVLMVGFGIKEVFQREEFDHNLFPDLGFEFGEFGLQNGAYGGVGVVDAGAILRADVVALAVEGGGVDAAEIELHEEGEGELFGIVVDAYGFGKARFSGAHLLVGGMVDVAVGISGLGVDDAADLLEVVFGAPEATAGEIEGGSGVGHGGRGMRVRRLSVAPAGCKTEDEGEQQGFEKSEKRGRKGHHGEG